MIHGLTFPPFPATVGEWATIEDAHSPISVVRDKRPRWNGKAPYPDVLMSPHIEVLAYFAAKCRQTSGDVSAFLPKPWQRGITHLLLWGPRSEKGDLTPDEGARPSLDEVGCVVAALFRVYAPPADDDPYSMNWRQFVANGDGLQRHWKNVSAAMSGLEEQARAPDVAHFRKLAWAQTLEASRVVMDRPRWTEYTPDMPEWFSPRFESTWREVIRRVIGGQETAARQLFDSRFELGFSPRLPASPNR